MPAAQPASLQDPFKLDLYAQRSAFLADINCEALGGTELRRAQYRANLASLERLVLFQ